MRKGLLVTLFLISGFHLESQSIDNLSYGTDSTFEVVTWNIEWFAKNEQITVDYVTRIIQALDVDVVAVQEIDDEANFEKLLENLEGWDGYYMKSDYLELGYVYKTADIGITGIFGLFPTLGREFPREPLVMEMSFKGEEMVIINNHLKCCGNGTLNQNDPWDEETRRLDAMNELYHHINVFYPDRRIILLGDFNDILTDDPANNVFKAFMDDQENFLVTDMEIAEGSSFDWSYPTWPSHLDHIIISNELFNDFGHDSSDIRVIKVEEYLGGGWGEYEDNISDHRPVALKLFKSEPTGIEDNIFHNANLTNYPNPFSKLTTISFDPVMEGGELEIFNINGMRVEVLSLIEGQSSVVWNAGHYSRGVYYVRLITGSRVEAVRKMVVIKM